MKKFLPAFAALILLMMACHKDKDKNTPAPSYDRKAMLENIGNNIILPSYKGFADKTDSLWVACTAFTGNPSEASLLRAQNAWKEASAQWKQCELYNLGPVEDLLLRTSIDAWPVNTANIETVINTTSTIDNAYIEQRSIYTKGLKAVEYLLFDPSGDNASLISRYTGGGLSENRKSYLTALSENLHHKATEVYEAWAPEKGNYVSVFINASGTDVGSSLGKLVNQMVGLTDQIANMKLATPLGITNGGVTQPDLVESPQSGTSLEEIKYNLTSLENTFLGRTVAGQDQQGPDDLLASLGATYNGQPLVRVIRKKMDSAIARINSIPPPLEEAVNNDPEAVNEAYTTVKELLVLLKVDMASSLGVLITYTDNDGD